MKYTLCPTTEIRYDTTGFYIYRHFDGESWKIDLLLDNLVFDIINMFLTPNCIEYVLKNYAKSEEKVVLEVVNSLINVNLLLENNYSSLDVFFKERVGWLDENWKEAFNYHLHTNNISKIDYLNPNDSKKNDFEMMEYYLINQDVPSNYKHALLSHPRYELSSFIDYSLIDDFNVFITKSTQEPKKPLEICIDHINMIVNYTYIQTEEISMISTGKHIRKPVPSGGARHPTECYICVLSNSIIGIRSGVYHYNVKNHRLDEIDIEQSHLCKFEKYLKTLPRDQDKKLSFCFINTIAFERSMYRYKEPRSYRVMHFDLGHIMANFSIVSRLLGLPFSNVFSVADSAVESLLGVNPYYESVMSASLVFE